MTPERPALHCGCCRRIVDFPAWVKRRHPYPVHCRACYWCSPTPWPINDAERQEVARREAPGRSAAEAAP